MRGVEYAELETFLAVGDQGSFRGAAEVLAVSPSAVSHTIRALEERVGVRLFHRTTRSLALTEDGARLRESVRPAFEAIARSMAEAGQRAKTPSGTVRLTTPRVASQMVLAPRLPAFLRRHPGIRVEVDIDDQTIDSVAEGYDAGIRLGETVRNDMESVALTPVLTGMLVASPDYLARRSTPRTPGDLAGHDWLNYRLPGGRLLPWELAADGGVVAMSEAGPLATNDADLLIAAAVEGCGIACVTGGTVEDHLEAGRLQVVLGERSEPYPGWRLYYPRGRTLPAALRLLRDYMAVPSQVPPEAGGLPSPGVKASAGRRRGPPAQSRSLQEGPPGGRR